MISHITLGVADVHAARKFYDPLLERLGLSLKFADGTWAGWKDPASERPLFIITVPFNGAASSAGNGQMIAFFSDSRSSVDQCYALALEHGGTGEGEPGLRAGYHPHYYGTYFRDPYGNKLCVCCHEAE